MTFLGADGGKAALAGELAPGEQVAVGQENRLLTLVDGKPGHRCGRNEMKVVERYIRKPHLVLSFVILLSVVGLIGYKKMPFNLFPDTDRPQISVVTVMPGAAAADVETDITRIIEKEVSTIDMVRKVTSTSKDEVSVVTAEFEYAKGLDAAATDVANALSKVGARLPPAIRPPQIFKISQATQPTMTLALSPAPGSSADLRKIRELADNPIKEELLRVPDIANVEVFGGAPAGGAGDRGPGPAEPLRRQPAGRHGRPVRPEPEHPPGAGHPPRRAVPLQDRRGGEKHRRTEGTWWWPAGTPVRSICGTWRTSRRGCRNRSRPTTATARRRSASTSCGARTAIRSTPSMAAETTSAEAQGPVPVHPFRRQLHPEGPDRAAA